MRWAAALRRELSARNQQIAVRNGSLHELTTGEMASVIFGCNESRRRLKIRLRELGLDHEGSEFHVDLGAVRPATAEGNLRPESKLRHKTGRDAQHGTQGRVAERAPAAKDIHKQRV
jgi:hypothetical protein